ncbi:hypothetical protein Taro_049934 [Colocasia esculenta]|uniref:Uncharacterized protein n=1 Tax=Colocasia esculenta TaxID=4460 RepID=A0A843XCF7_COLES|nr:hypothetical protein [Colocasia esculenta]
MSSCSESQVRRSRTMDGVPSHSSEDFIVGHSSQALVPTTQGASSVVSASSSVVETPTWGRGIGRQGPSRGAKERRIEPRHKWNCQNKVVLDRNPRTCPFPVGVRRRT